MPDWVNDLKFFLPTRVFDARAQQPAAVVTAALTWSLCTTPMHAPSSVRRRCLRAHLRPQRRVLLRAELCAPPCRRSCAHGGPPAAQPATQRR